MCVGLRERNLANSVQIKRRQADCGLLAQAARGNGNSISDFHNQQAHVASRTTARWLAADELEAFIGVVCPPRVTVVVADKHSALG